MKTNSTIPISELRKLPYLLRVPRDDRVAPLINYYDPEKETWQVWHPNQKGDLMAINVTGLSSGMYVASAPERLDSDCRLPLAEVILQRFSLPEMVHLLSIASQDLVNGLAHIEKYFIFQMHSAEGDSRRMAQIVQVEIEGMFGNHRSFYDVIQKIIATIVKHYAQSPATLPDSFAKMVQKENKELRDRYGLPEAMVQFYAEKRELFLACRKIRDNVFHHGHSFQPIFVLANGFAVIVDQPPWDELLKLVPKLWPEKHRKNERLASILVLFTLLVEDMHKTMGWLGATILASFAPPPDTLFDMPIFLRTPLGIHLNNLTNYQETHWFNRDHAASIIEDTEH